MRRSGLLFFIAVLLVAPRAYAALSYNLAYSTYLGGSSWEHARDIYTDANGFTYVVGGTGSGNFTGAGSYPGSNIYNAGQPNNIADGAFGGADVFVTKLDSTGQVLWSKYMGGQNYDRAYAVEVDNSGNVYVGGRAGIGFPTTAGLQTTFQGPSNPSSYGSQNGFVTKLDSNGQIQWSTYLGTGELVRDLAIDGNGSIYVPLVMANISSRTLDAGYFGGKIKNSAPTTNTNDVGVAKIDSATGQLVWARWLGGTGSEATNPSIRVNAAGEAYLLFDTTSSSTTGLPAVGAVSQTNRLGTQDAYLAKFAADGSGLVYGTYLGGTGTEGHETHSLALDQNGNAVVAIITASTDYPVTPGALNITSGTAGNIGITRFDAAGARVASAVVGGSGGENPDGIYIDGSGRIFIAGETSGTNFPVTTNAYQTANAGSNDGFLLVLSPDLSGIEYSTYFGGTLYDNGRTLFLGNDGSLYTAGGTLSTNLPVLNATDSTFNGGSHPNAPGSGDAWAAKFALGSGPALAGDFNYDGMVDARDYVVWRHNHGSAADYGLWRANFGNGVPASGSAASAAVPEPSAILYLAVAAFAFATRRSGRCGTLRFGRRRAISTWKQFLCADLWSPDSVACRWALPIHRAPLRSRLAICGHMW